MTDRQLGRAWSIVGGSAFAIVGTFLPWLRSGAVDRSSYEIFDLVDRLGFAPDGMIGWMLRLWPFVPLLFVFGSVAQFLPNEYVGIRFVRWLIPLVAAAYAGGIAIALRFAPEAGLFSFRYGTGITAVGSLVVATAVLGPLLSRIVRAR